MRVGVLLILGACGPEPAGPGATGGQSGEDPGYGDCEETVAVLGPDELVDGLGFTAAELRATADGVFPAVLAWDDGATTGLAVTLAWDGEARAFVPTDPVYCSARIELDGSYSFVTEDGRLDEAGDATLSATAASPGSFGDRWDALGGTFTLPDATSLELRALVDATGVRGELALTGQRETTSCGVVAETCGGPPIATFQP